MSGKERVEEILCHLPSCGWGDLDGHYHVYLTCYKVLHENGDARALEVLRTAHTLLLERAEAIEDEELRHLFLEQVEVNREILTAWEAHQEGGQ